ncbi:sensor histidine kinase [Chitinophaga polysaccharea]|uniref:sensor histidine kinase n=1 Tax=Chitinophaga polysaccharea TaxID=1293035 RepID=UPI00115A76FE|nr:histidine kinase [Chitinophaga polysaccharea]
MKILANSNRLFPWFTVAILAYMTWDILWLIIARGKMMDTGIYIIFYVVDVSIFIMTAYRFLPGIYTHYTQQIKRFIAVSATVLFNSCILILGNLLTKAYLTGTFTFFISKEDYLVALTRSFFLMAISFGVWENKYRVSKERQLADEQKAMLFNENEILRLENELYRSQINPHLLNNSINGILARLSAEDTNTLEILRLWSGVTHYCLQPGDKLGKVPLSEDMENLRRYIQLHTILKQGKFYVKLNISNEDPQIMIPPLLFIDLVDNIIKYGVYDSSAEPAVIVISQQGKVFSLYTSNHKPKIGIETQSTGIGLNNLKDRLERYYSGKYDLRVTDDEMLFELTLNMEL